MAIKRTTIDGTKIICEIESSNLIKTEYDSETNDVFVVTEPQDVYQFAEVFSGPSSSYPPNGVQNYIAVNFGNYFYSPPEHVLCHDDFPKTFNDTALETSHGNGYEGTLTLTVNYTISIDR